MLCFWCIDIAKMQIPTRILLYFAGSRRYASRTTDLTSATWASTTGQQGRRSSWLRGMFFLLSCVSTISALIKHESVSWTHGVLWWDTGCMSRDPSKAFCNRRQGCGTLLVVCELPEARCHRYTHFREEKGMSSNADSIVVITTYAFL